MQDRVLNNPKVEVIWNSALDEVLGTNMPKKVTHVRLRSTLDDSVSEMQIDGVFVAIGHKPNSDLFKGVLEMEPNGYLVPQPGSTRTKIPGVFIAGDVGDQIYRQAITAAGSGCMAAIDAERYLESIEAAECSAV
jgi:thioredoxin reductase (NADPH)